MPTTNIKHISNLAEILAANKIRTIVISPGSRNAPLVIAFENQPDIKTYVVHDERSAAYFALGIAEAINEPVGIVCTSGSAPLNYAPAVSEAYYREIPLLVLTADRPAYLIDQGDGQCINQKLIYQNYSKSFYNLPEKPKTESELAESNAIVSHAVTDLKNGPKGPVHINIPLHEPLYSLEEEPVSYIPQPVEVTSDSNNLPETKKATLQQIWRESPKKMIIIGQLLHTEVVKPIIDLLTNDSGVAILVENTSNLHNYYKYCHSIDRTLALISPEEIEAFKPDLLISFGGAIVSKKIKHFLRTNRPKHNWRIGNYTIDEDTFLSKTETIKSNPVDVLSLFTDIDNESNSSYGSQWKSKDFMALEKHNAFLNTCSYSDLLVFDYLLDTLPESSILQMGNSSVIRYCQLFNIIPTVRYFSNRGVSGIDGSTSTAVGMAVAKPDQLVTLITGDVSFFYDSNGLWNSYLPANLRIILISNGGGGIFNILEGPRKSPQNKVFVAPHSAKAEFVCKAFDVHYSKVDSIETLAKEISQFYNFSDDQRPKLIEVDTSQVDNHKVLMDYFSFLSH